MEQLIDAYEELLILHDPLTEVLNTGSLEEFKKWYYSWMPEKEKDKQDLINFNSNVLIPKLIDYEYYEWIKEIK